MGETIVGRGQMLIVICAGLYGPAAVALAASVRHADDEAARQRREDLIAGDRVDIVERGEVVERVPLESIRFARDRGEIQIMERPRCMGKTMAPALIKAAIKEAATALPHDDRSWVRMNDHHNRRAGRRSHVIPRVICPA